jgi:hypothetical protein
MLRSYYTAVSQYERYNWCILLLLTSSPLAALSIATGFILADASRFSSFVSRDAADSVFDRLGVAVGGTGFASFWGGVEVCCAELAPSPCCVCAWINCKTVAQQVRCSTLVA